VNVQSNRRERAANQASLRQQLSDVSPTELDRAALSWRIRRITYESPTNQPTINWRITEHNGTTQCASTHRVRWSRPSYGYLEPHYRYIVLVYI